VSILDVQDFKAAMVTDKAAPKTLNRRISSLSSFYKFFERRRGRAAAADHRSQSGPRPVYFAGIRRRR